MSDESPTTDKGRPRQQGASETSGSSTNKSPATKPAAKKSAAKKPAAKKSTAGDDTSAPAADQAPKTPAPSSDGPTGRPLTASDYARTTSSSASSTAVMPAVKERPEEPRTTERAPAASSSPKSGVAAGGRAASLRISHVEPWSVTRMAFAISVALMIVAVVAVAIFWLVLEALGIWDQIDGSVTTVLSDDSTSFSITDYLGFGRLVGLALVLSALNVLITTVLATIAAHLYNLAAQLLGGFQVTFTSQD